MATQDAVYVSRPPLSAAPDICLPGLPAATLGGCLTTMSFGPHLQNSRCLKE